MTFGNLTKPVFIVSILAFSLVGLGFILPPVNADHGEDPGITKPVFFGPNTLNFRDITNVAEQTSTLTVDFSSVKKKGLVTITLEELAANLDATAIDTVIVTASSTSSGADLATVTLTESDVNSGIFSGTLILGGETLDDKLQVKRGDVVTVNYEDESKGVGGLQAVFNLLTPGNIVITDKLINLDTFRINEGVNWRPVIHPVNIDLGGATLDPNNPPVITLSYANAVFQEFDNPAELNMYYNPGPVDIGLPDPLDVGWTIVRDWSVSPNSHDPVGMTITSDPDSAQFGQVGGVFFFVLGNFAQINDAKIVLGFESGIGGGGGGGLVRPGFVVNALAGANVISSFFGKGGAGDFTGSSNSGPKNTIVSSGSVGIISEDSIGFLQQGVTSDSDSDSTSNSLDSTQKIGIGEDRSFKYDVYNNKGTDDIIHSTMYFFDAQTMDSKDRIDVSKSETYIMFNKGKPVQVVDPHGYFEKAGFEISEIDTFNSALNYDVTFGKNMPESHIALRTWNAQKYSTDTFYPNAVVVTETSIADNDNPSIDNEPLTQSEFESSPFLDTQNESQLTEEETITKTGFPGIPLWVKNNAMWWHEKQIGDEDFVAGIQYMINEEIITIPETEIKVSTSEEIPQWISNVAGYWSNALISDDEFISAMQWLVSNGVMEV